MLYTYSNINMLQQQMRKYLNIIIYMLVIVLPKTSLANNHSLYSYAGILPVTKDSNNNTWVYLGVEYVNNEKRLAILAGQKDKEDKDSITTALRELNEESLDVFNDYININKLSDNTIGQINYNILFLLSTKLYIYPLDVYNANNSCDAFIQLYNQRRYSGSGKYKRLKLVQRETYGLRKVKLNTLIDFLENPEKYDNKLTSYGGKNCSETDKIPLRWSSKIILKNQPILNKLL